LFKLLIILSLFGCNKKVDFTINVADFGLKPNSKENAIPSIIKAIAECKKHPNAILKFEKGRYDFMIDPAHSREYFESNTTNDGKKNLAILIEDCTGLTLDGGGSDFIFHGAIQPITIDHSDNIKIQNINIDWDLPLTAQAKVWLQLPKTLTSNLMSNSFHTRLLMENWFLQAKIGKRNQLVLWNMWLTNT